MSELHQAAQRGDIAEMQRLLAAGVPVDLRDENGQTPLMEACLSSEASLTTLDFLIDHGADVNALVQPPPPVSSPDLGDFANIDGFEPATRTAIEQVRSALHQYHSLREKQGEERNSVLGVAVKCASLEKLRLLIQSGADPTFATAHGYTPVILAACAGRMEVIELLLAAGASADCSSIHGESPVRCYSRTGNFREIRMLLDLGADPAPLGWTPLLHAVALGTLDEVASLLDQGADPEATDSWERTAFLLAVHAGDVAKADLLLSRGANRNATGRCGRTAMHYPIDRDDAAMLRWLLSRGFDKKAKDRFGHSPMMEAVEESAVACFHALLEAGAGWKAGKYNHPLLHSATHPEIIRRLLDLGENPGQMDKEALRNWIGLVS